MKRSHLATLLPLTVILACAEGAGPTGTEPDLLPAGEPAAIIDPGGEKLGWGSNRCRPAAPIWP